MYGSSPAIFRDVEAAILAARSYAIEEGMDYGVWQKKMDYGTDNVWYKPVSANDSELAEKEGYKIIRICKKREL